MQYTVYILECDNGSFYIGHSRNKQLRFLRHKNKTGAEYTKSHTPKNIVYTEHFDDKTKAVRREIQLKNGHMQKRKHLLMETFSF